MRWLQAVCGMESSLAVEIMRLSESSFNRIRRVLSTSFSGVFDTAGFIEDQDGVPVIGREGTTLYISLDSENRQTGSGLLRI